MNDDMKDNSADGMVTVDVMPASRRPPISDQSLARAGMVITFKDLEYVVVNSSNRKEKVSLLKKVNGFFSAGQMSALMGPSGSGKTTLLDVIAGRKTQGEIRGSILFAQRPPTQRFLRRYTGYVEQFDTLLSNLTVKEMLMYTAELKRSMAEPLADKATAVDQLIEDLALVPCANTRIGDTLHRGISGGQAKRTNIGVALVTNPRVLFLDEPTSGLDSYTSNEVMAIVKELTTRGVTICATIHSPSQYAFDLFDNVMMLVRGQVVYFGSRTQAMDYFTTNLPDMKSTLPVTNDAEWLTDVITRGDRDHKGGVMAEAYAKSSLRQEMQDSLELQMQTQSNIDEETLKELSVNRATATPTYWALWALFKFLLLGLLQYRTLANYKDPEFLGPRMADKIIVGLLIMSLYWGIGDDMDPDNITNILAVLFMCAVLPAFGASAYIPALVLERPLYIRERSDGLYQSMTYLVSKMFDELILAFGISLVFSSIVWFPVDFRGEFVVFWLVYLASLSTGIILAYLVAALSPSMDVANAALPAYGITLVFFTGFLIRNKDIPDYWIWYSKISFVRYSWGAMVINVFDGSSATVDGEGVLEFYSLDDVSKWTYLGYIMAFFASFFILAWLALTYKKQANR